MSSLSHSAGSGQSLARPAILVALGFAGVIGALMQTLVLPLLPLFPSMFNVSIAAASWVATSTMLVGAIGAPLVGWLGDRFGLKSMIMLSLIALAIGSFISALATDFTTMIIGRVLQGFSVGIVGLSMAMLRRLWHVEGLPMAVGIIGGTIGIGTSLGVPLAGFIVSFGTWQTLFWIMGGSAVLATLLIWVLVPSVAPISRQRFDLTGALGLGLILTLILLPLSLAADGEMSIPMSATLLTLAAALLCAWVWHQNRTPQPFVDLSLLQVPAVSTSHLIALFLGFGFFLSFTGTITISQMPMHNGVGLGGTVLTTGFVQLPASLIAIVAPPLAGLMVVHSGVRAAIATGIAVSIAAFLARCFYLDNSIYVALSTMFLSGGISFAFAALPVALMSATPTDKLGASNGFNMLSRQMGAAAASVAGAVIVALHLDYVTPSGPEGFYWLFGLGGVSTLIALILALSTKTLNSAPLSQETLS